MDKENLYLTNIDVEYVPHNYIEEHDERQLVLSFETEDDKKFVIKLTKNDILSIIQNVNEVLESDI